MIRRSCDNNQVETLEDLAAALRADAWARETAWRAVRFSAFVELLMMVTIFSGILMLGILVLFMSWAISVAKFSGVKVLKFSLGFGPR